MDKVYGDLKRMREVSGLSKKQIAEFLNITQKTITKVETGQSRLTARQVEKLASLYGCNLSELSEGLTKEKSFVFGKTARDLMPDDLKSLADIGRIAANSCFISNIARKPRPTKSGVG